MVAASGTCGIADRHARRGGFTFVEILATLTLMAIVLPVVMNGISMSLSAGSFAKKQATAASLCQGKMNELLATGQVQRQVLSGDFAPDQPDYRWTAEVTDWEGTTLQQLDVKVLWRNGDKDRDVTLSTLIYSGATQ